MRLNKYIASLNIASRREADKLIQNGNIKVNGEIITNPATQVNENDKVECNIKKYKEEKIYIKLNKPVGYVVSSNKKEGQRQSSLSARNVFVLFYGRKYRRNQGKSQALFER